MTSHRNVPVDQQTKKHARENRDVNDVSSDRGVGWATEDDQAGKSWSSVRLKPADKVKIIDLR